MSPGLGVGVLKLSGLWHYGSMEGMLVVMSSTRDAVDEIRNSAASDPAWAIRVFTEYASNAARGVWDLITVDPGLPRSWNTTLAAITCWAADYQGTPRPKWAEACPAMDPPWDPLESLGVVFDHALLKDEEYLPVMVAKGIRLTENDLWTF